jgi:hypothetical protein
MLRGVDVLTRRLFVVLLLLIFLLAACAPAAVPIPDVLPVVVTITSEPAQAILASPPAATSETPAFTPLPGASPTLDISATPEFTATPTGPTPTETLLPLLELPTEKSGVPALVAWTGLPTYAGDSEAGRLFRLDYDPDIWAQTEGNYGDIVLAHRQIGYCTISPWSGRGLPSDSKVEHEFRLIGNVPYDINTVIIQDNVKFVAYVGGDKRLLTGFQVSFEEQKEQCLQDAEVIFATLRSFAAQPSATPSLTPEPTATP